MKSFYLIVLILILGILTLSAGCSSAGEKATTTNPPAETPAPSPPSNITYDNHGLWFIYPDNLRLTEADSSDARSARWDSGDILLKGASENDTVSWISMHHKPPNIPVIYESMRTTFQQDPKISDAKFFLLETYPVTTCGDATLIGHVSFYDMVRKTQVNEGIMFWYHPRQDRTYIIDVASGNDYQTSVRETLAGYQQSFRCMDS